MKRDIRDRIARAAAAPPKRHRVSVIGKSQPRSKPKPKKDNRLRYRAAYRLVMQRATSSRPADDRLFCILRNRERMTPSAMAADVDVDFAVEVKQLIGTLPVESVDARERNAAQAIAGKLFVEAGIVRQVLRG